MSGDIRDFVHLDERDLATISRGNCPCCNNRGWVIGPGVFPTQAPAGFPLSFQLNIECANIGCRCRFNVAFYSGEAMMAHTLPPGPPWPSEPT
jgi:hypothetical protein